MSYVPLELDITYLLACLTCGNRKLLLHLPMRGAWWRSGRVLVSSSRGCGSQPHQRQCIVSLSKTLYHLLSTGTTQEDTSGHDRKNVD